MSLFKSLRTLGRPLVVHRKVASAFGLLEGHFLEQIAYWMDKTEADVDEWVYKTSEEIESETSLTYKQQIRIREVLVDLGVLEERHDRVRHCIFFRVNQERFDALVEQAPDLSSGTSTLPKVSSRNDQRSDGTLPKVSSYKGTESTQESTQEIASEQEVVNQHSLAELWKEMRRAFKRRVGRSLGSGIKGHWGERFVEIVHKYGTAKVLAGFEEFINRERKEWLKRMDAPVIDFIKNAESWIDDASIQIEEPKPEQVAGPRGVDARYAHLIKH